MNSVIITGATSMIAAGLIEECLQRQIKIFAVVHPQSKNIKRIPHSDLIKIIKCEHQNYLNLQELINQPCDIFYHFAWLGTGKYRNDNPYIQVENIRSSLDSVIVAAKLGCKKYIGAGSQAEYGKVDLLPIGPDTLTEPNTPYGISKYAAGKLVLYEALKLGIDCIWTRIFSVYGKYDKPTSMIMTTIEKLLTGEIPEFTKAEHRWDYLYYTDAGKALFLLGEYGKGGDIYCIGSGVSKPLKDFINIIKESIDPKKQIFLGKMPYPPEGPISLHADISKLVEDTGFNPAVSFESGIKLTLDWYKMKRNDETS